MIGRPLLRQQTYRWTLNCLFSSERDMNPHAPNRDYFGREREASAFEKAEEASAPWWLRAFATKTRRRMDLYRFHPKYFTISKFKAWLAKHERNMDIMGQAYVPERHKVLGSDLATAHFIVYRGGKVKFAGRDDWIVLDEKTKLCEELPVRFTRGWYVEALDVSGTGLRYEGLVNLVSLKKLKWLSLKDCEHVDNWFLDRLSGEVGETVEYLDLSGCTQLTEEILSCMYRFKNLKELDLTGIPTTSSFELGCLLLEDAIPGLKIKGVEYRSLPMESEQKSLNI
uniref:ATP synthase subunit s-like protein n=1 Tax=Lygus hesperus TaxID=30085 RepID=A0A0A9WJY5_LYGHE